VSLPEARRSTSRLRACAKLWRPDGREGAWRLQNHLTRAYVLRRGAEQQQAQIRFRKLAGGRLRRVRCFPPARETNLGAVKKPGRCPGEYAGALAAARVTLTISSHLARPCELSLEMLELRRPADSFQS
jgi:hypothetical protein